MSLLRNDIQVALQWLHEWAQETMSHFRFVADHDIGKSSAALCRELAAERELLSSQLAAAIRETGDLPAGPDPDREAALQLQEQLADVLSEQGGEAMLEHCRSREESLLEQVSREAGVLDGTEYAELLVTCKRSAEKAASGLRGPGSD